MSARRDAAGRRAPFTHPITLPVELSPGIKLDGEIALRTAKNEFLAVMTIGEICEWDHDEVAQKVFGTLDARDPLVAEMHRWGSLNMPGGLCVPQLPAQHGFRELGLAPAKTRPRLEAFGRPNVVAFQTRNPLHRVHEELTKRAAPEVDGVLLLRPVVGMTKPGDADHRTRVRAHKALTERYYDGDRVLLSLLPLAMRLAGPREALSHMPIRPDYGANHAASAVDSRGKPFYGPYDTQGLAEKHSEQLGVKVVPLRMLVYPPLEERCEEVSRVPAGVVMAAISGTQVREEYLNDERKPPEWLTRPEVAEILAERCPPWHRQSVCIWFTGLSDSGKSATA